MVTAQPLDLEAIREDYKPCTTAPADQRERECHGCVVAALLSALQESRRDLAVVLKDNAEIEAVRQEATRELRESQERSAKAEDLLRAAEADLAATEREIEAVGKSCCDWLDGKTSTEHRECAAEKILSWRRKAERAEAALKETREALRELRINADPQMSTWRAAMDRADAVLKEGE